MTPPEPEYRTIPLTQGKVAIVDAADYGWLNQWKWYAARDNTTESFYAVRNSERLSTGFQRPIKMHREILGLKFNDKRHADHENHDTLDNRRSNLRIASPSQSACNRSFAIGKHGAHGVHLRGGTWQARISVNRRRISLGNYKTKEEAALVYEDAKRRFHGEFARIV